MLKEPNKEVKDVAIKINRITGFKTAYGNDHFKNIEVRGPFVRVDVGNTNRKSLNIKILAARTVVLKILERFYKKHLAIDTGSHLILRNIGIYGDFLIVNQNSDILAKLPSKLQKKMLNLHVREFGMFADFLKK